MPNGYSKTVKKPGLTHNYTQEEISELKKCASDPVYFSKYIKIVHPINGVQNIELFPYQKIILRGYNDPDKKHVISLNSRQIGGSTISMIYTLWYALFKQNKFIAHISHKHDMAKRINGEIKFMYENLPSFLKPGVHEYNMNMIRFENGSQIYFRGCTVDCLRSCTVNLLMLDDFSFVDKQRAREFWFSNWPIISHGGKVVINTCLNGSNELITDLWKTGGDHWKRIIMPWSLHPDRNNEWKQKMVNNMGKQSFKQEYLDFGVDCYSKGDDEISKMWVWFNHLKDLDEGKVVEI